NPSAAVPTLNAMQDGFRKSSTHPGDIRRTNMLYRSLAGALALTAALVMTVSAARAFDESKYPAFQGQWKRKLGTVNAWDESRRAAGPAAHTGISQDVARQHGRPGRRRAGPRHPRDLHLERHAAHDDDPAPARGLHHAVGDADRVRKQPAAPHLHRRSRLGRQGQPALL